MPCAVAASAQSQAASAPSQVTIYGIAAIEAIHVNNVVTAGVPGTGTQNKLDNSPVWSSRLGFRGSEDLGDAHPFHSLPELGAVDAVPIAEKVARCRVLGEGLDDLLGSPSGVGESVTLKCAT